MCKVEKVEKVEKIEKGDKVRVLPLGKRFYTPGSIGEILATSIAGDYVLVKFENKLRLALKPDEIEKVDEQNVQ